MNALQEVKSHLTPSQVYRRADLLQWSNAVDRHLLQLQKEKALVKLSAGLYYCPKNTSFGISPPKDKDLVRAFLKDHRFLLTTPNAYNTLGVGTTQLYNEVIVYNHKRHGMFKLGGRGFRFVMKHYFPLEANKYFLLVDLVDHITRVTEHEGSVLEKVKDKALKMNSTALKQAVQKYGGVRARKFFAAVLHDESLIYGPDLPSQPS